MTAAARLAVAKPALEVATGAGAAGHAVEPEQLSAATGQAAPPFTGSVVVVKVRASAASQAEVQASQLPTQSTSSAGVQVSVMLKSPWRWAELPFGPEKDTNVL